MTKMFLPFHFSGDNRDLRYHFQRRRYWYQYASLMLEHVLRTVCNGPYVRANISRFLEAFDRAIDPR